MIELPEIKRFYPDSLHSYDRFLLKEYLQYKILEIVFSSKNPTSPWIGGARSGSYFAPDGVYSYLIKAKFTNGEAREFRGFISLIR
jgi:hypothetical protein